METVFQSITAELSKEFENLLVDKYTKDFLEKVCDLTGTLILCNTASPTSTTQLVAQESLKICGSWSSVAKAHNILTAYTVLREIMGADYEGRDNSFYDTTVMMSDYPPMPLPVTSVTATHKHKRKRKNVNSDETVVTKHSLEDNLKTKEFPQLNDNTPVPILLSSVENEAGLVYSAADNLQENKADLQESTPDYESNMYFVNSQDSTSDFEVIQNATEGHEDDGTKEVFNCAMCKYSTNSAKNLESHLDRYHFKPVTCQICGRGFGYDRDLKRHLMKNKYSCGSRRSVVNRNYVKAKPISDNYTSMKTSESGDLIINVRNQDIAQACQEDKKNNLENEEKSLEENITLKIKQEPFLVDNNDTYEKISHCNISQNDSLMQEISLTGRNSKDEKNSPKEIQFEDYSRSDDSTDMHGAHNQGCQSTETEHNDTDTSCKDDYSTTATRTKVNKMTFACKHCSYTAHKKQHIIDHVCRMHKKQFQCDHCHSAFGLTKDLHRHLRRSHGVEIPFKRS